MAIKTLAILLIVSYFNASYALSAFSVGRVNIDITDKEFKCDKIVCPANAEHCIVTLEKDPRNERIVAHTNVCLSATGAVLDKKTWYKGTFGKPKVNVRVEGSRYEGKYKPLSFVNDWDAANASSKEDTDAFNRAVEELSKDFN
ncbi:uncharacterized protein LOC142234403 [Haematobia irritans]|uniref:Putative secreted protein n=2 Tax=Haematobia irritans TaxID=7368 RepID=A0A1L8EHX5_HAEIR